MLERVISGGQSGTDIAGWRAARVCGLLTGGFMPLGFLTEDGPRPEYAEMYGAIELPTSDYPTRTRRNVIESSATIWFGSLDSPGAITTHRACMDAGRPIFDVVEGRDRPSDVVRWLRIGEFRTLNVSGNRESTSPVIGEKVEWFLMMVFRKVAKA